MSPNVRFAASSRSWPGEWLAATFGGLGAGVLMAGAGGRLVMRLLGFTAGPAAQGRITEADQPVGVITFDGSFGFVVFTAIFFGIGSGILYVFLRRWLPSGRVGGLAYGLLLLAAFATRTDPLRPDNVDFDLVGPGWLAVVTFVPLVVVHGMLVAALTNRWESFAAGLRGRRRWFGLTPFGLYIVVLPFLAIALFGTAIAAVLAADGRATRWFASDRVTAAGRALLAGVVAVSLPFTLAQLVDIAGRTPG